ncbi:hypothetical protein HELRODRAFT_166056 [Helobdella robusta]|uniref:Uncharacterized protein n=1 Tax=Helobdella robusta TaxID=6412 RepID=T1EXN3_HELRO|nr:hypothetical protein HELRODRAFT_166056 [Helobdella robusta]ESN90391.1 hypothetical protein HELRODRAFT_166056 [Helobdella robusta]
MPLIYFVAVLSCMLTTVDGSGPVTDPCPKSFHEFLYVDQKKIEPSSTFLVLTKTRQCLYKDKKSSDFFHYVIPRKVTESFQVVRSFFYRVANVNRETCLKWKIFMTC